MWDLAEGTLLTELRDHTDTIYSLQFSRDGNILASGGLDCCLKLWNARGICNPDEEEETDQSNGGASSPAEFLLGSYPTKNTPIHSLNFTLRNLLLASGPFLST